MQKQAHYLSPTRPDTLGGNLPLPVWMSPVVTCHVTSGELPPLPPDDFQTQLSTEASSGLGWPSTHTSDTLPRTEEQQKVTVKIQSATSSSR